MPQPKVSSGLLRSSISISCSGLLFMLMQVQARGSATHTNYLHVTLRSRSAPGLDVLLV